MIISASRRTDIPAFYSEWLLNRLRAGYVQVKNPMNPRQISQLSLRPETVDCIVFWTKNAAPMMNKLDVMDAMGYKYYFQWTITPYGRDIEPKLPEKIKILESFKRLSEKIGSQRIVWRYDPVIVCGRFPVEYHLREFAKMCRELAGYTKQCIFSYVDLYAKIKKGLKVQNLQDTVLCDGVMCHIAEEFAATARLYGLSLATCAEQLDLQQFGIAHAACIDKQRIEEITGYRLKTPKEENQRSYCRCIQSVDIGAYDSCIHGCVYCYANSQAALAERNRKKHNNRAPLLLDNSCSGDKITIRAVKSLRDTQGSLSDEW